MTAVEAVFFKDQQGEIFSPSLTSTLAEHLVHPKIEIFLIFFFELVQNAVFLFLDHIVENAPLISDFTHGAPLKIELLNQCTLILWEEG